MNLGVNLDHVCTLRQARYKGEESASFAEPNLLQAARLAVRAGADQITVHLREDRRHLQDRDLEELRWALRVPLNLEMALSEDVLALALKIVPDRVTLVPERRQEVTTEGGLDVVQQSRRISAAILRLHRAGIPVSCFVAPSTVQIRASSRAGADAVELHTGAFARGRKGETARLKAAAKLAKSLGLAVYAGHGLTAANLGPVVRIPQVEELNIGHSIVSRAVFVGLSPAIREIQRAIAASGRSPRRGPPRRT